MIRNLVLKLPSIRCTSENAFSSLYRKRSFRSLSPAQRLQSVASVVTERSVSSSRAERGHSVADISGKPQARTLCFSKEYYEKSSNEVQWQENPPNKDQDAEQPKENTSFNNTDPIQFESLEQYELEAARPRPKKSREMIDAFVSQSQKGRYYHLQPSEIKPYGSPDNLYSPMLIRPTNSLKYPKKFKKNLLKNAPKSEKNSNADVPSSPRGERNFCTSTRPEIARELSTTKRCIAKEGHSTKDKTRSDIRSKRRNDLKFSAPKLSLYSQFSKLTQDNYQGHLAMQNGGTFSITPPKYQPSRNVIDEDIEMPLELSTPEMRRRRKEEENRQGSPHYKLSYSDSIKLKLKEQEDAKITDYIVAGANSDQVCVGSILKNASKSNKMLDAFKVPSGRRSLTTKSKSNIMSGDNLQAPKNTKDQKHFSKQSPKDRRSVKPTKSNTKRPYNPKCENICSPIIKSIAKAKPKRIPYEPEQCEKETVERKIYLPSKVKLPVPPCTARPPYIDCKKENPCDIPRADECLEVVNKPLPKLVMNRCPCVDDGPPTYAPRLEKLHFKFEDPPKVVCHEPPCQTPRADDCVPFKYKPLKPYVPEECPCVEPPPMIDVKIKRLPRCAPEEVCRPPRICPVIEPCPPRADECYKLTPKKLPPLEGPPCPCVPPPPLKPGPPTKRLNLQMCEPERECPKPIPCSEVERADDCLKLKKKKLPKFVPGDCPCEDRPMLDWNLKRLVCEDELQNCIIPNPCKTFPRADWGCWEYTEDVCEVVDEKCIEKKVPCVKPKEKTHRKKFICETPEGAGLRDYRHSSKRKFSNASSSTLLHTCQLKNKSPQNQTPKNTNLNEADGNQFPKISKSASRMIKKETSGSALHLIKMLNDIAKSDKSNKDRLLFKPQKDDKIDFQNILRTIASTAAQFNIKETKAATIPVKKPKAQTLTVASRAISTTEHLQKTEADIKKEKDIEAKEKCKKVKPSIKSLMCKRSCPRYFACRSGSTARSPCKHERAPVCCEKEEPPYSSFSDNVEETIKPFSNTPQWTCNRPHFGFYPVYKKEHDPLNSKKKKDKKDYTTCSFLADLPVSETGNVWKSKGTFRPAADPGPYQYSSKVTPKKTKPSQECGKKSREKSVAPKITCHTEETCKADQRWCCKRDYSNPTTRVAPPFPAFSDCLDEEMEDILTECPLDKEKYLLMQPRFMNPPPKPLLLKPPPPLQGKLDILKEQQCLRDKFCIENEGLTQTCKNFGEPVPLMKTKKMVKEENWDCRRMEELKKEGRWPPFTLKSSRRYFTTSALLDNRFRSFSTLGPVNLENNTAVNRVYIRNYHALTKGPDKVVFGHNDEKLKELTQKIFPNINEATKLIKLKNNQWRNQNPHIYEHLQKQSNGLRRAKRYYTTYKIRRQNRLGTVGKHRVGNYFSRRFSIYSPLLKYRSHYYRGKRYYKDGKSKGINESEGCKIKSHRKACSKFTLNNCPSKANRRKCQKVAVWQECGKPFSPYPAYSECKEHEMLTPTCDCDFKLQKIENLQPRFSVLKQSTTIAKEFPSQERIDRTLGVEYYKCKHGIPNEGITIGCDALNANDNPPKKKKRKSLKAIDNDQNSQADAVVEFMVQEHKESKSTSVPDNCESDRKKLEELCLSECLKSVPCHLPEEEKYCICKARCQDVLGENEPPDCNEEKPKECPQKPTKPDCSAQETISPPISNNPTKSMTSVIPKVSQCRAKKATQLEVIWQKVVNYFKARPNCPQPGDYKKLALKQRAEKAANAAGLVVIDPKCLPPEILQKFKAPKTDCKVCPNQPDPCETKKSGTRSPSPEANRKNFSTNFQPSRSYSKSCKNLDEINKILEEGEMKRREVNFRESDSNVTNEYAKFSRRKDVGMSEALKMSLDVVLNKTVNMSELCDKKNKSQNTYFGYSRVLPSRENILEKAWRLSIETYNRHNYPRTYNIFNEFFTRVEKSIKTVEDLEKLKTENVLRELDEFLKNEEPDSKKKK